MANSVHSKVQIIYLNEFEIVEIDVNSQFGKMKKTHLSQHTDIE
jgi:hypothetical protein